MGDNDHQLTPPALRPRLWNPNAAACWSLVFSPAFGAYLHAANWRALGKPERAAANLVWVWVTVALLIANVATLFVPIPPALDRATQWVGVGLLIAWYVAEGRPHLKFVKEAVGRDYERRGWWRPLGIAFAAVVLYLSVIFGLVMALDKAPDKSNPQDLAAELKPLILQNWHKKPELHEATIDGLTLEHKGGSRFAGPLDATLNGQQVHLMLEVIVDGQKVKWYIKDPENSSANGSGNGD
jgi:hypothetical protein